MFYYQKKEKMFIEKVERLLRARFEVPKKFNKNHIILASFPKSGNTWFRFVSSNIIAKSIGKSEVNFDSIQRFAPVIRGNTNLKGIISCNAAPNFLKTHFYFVNHFSKYPALVIYRDPVRTFQSYFNYMNTEQKKNYLDIKRFISSARVGINAWNYFYKTWLSKEDAFFIYYDELIKNQLIGLDKIYKTFGYVISEETLNHSIRLSSRENMARIEAESGDPMKKNKKYKFVGTTESRYKKLDKDIEAFINERTSKIGKELNERKIQLF